MWDLRTEKKVKQLIKSKHRMCNMMMLLVLTLIKEFNKILGTISIGKKMKVRIFQLENKYKKLNFPAIKI